MKRNGGNLENNYEFWKSLILKACETGFEYIDLDFAEILKDRSILYEVKKSFPKVQLIISHHFKITLPISYPAADHTIWLQALD